MKPFSISRNVSSLDADKWHCSTDKLEKWGETKAIKWEINIIFEGFLELSYQIWSQMQ